MSNWKDFEFNKPYSGDLVKEINGVPLPQQYIGFMKDHNGGEGDIGETWLVLFPLEELDEINKELPPGVYMKANALGMAFPVYVDAAKSMAYDVYAQNNILRIAIILVAVIFSVVLLLMSVGSLANSVMISIDTSKKFIGLLKALGMRGKLLKMIVVLESITLITAGVLIGYLLLVALYNPLSSVISAVVSSSYGTYIEMVGFTPVMYMPFYVFAGTLVLFLIFTFLFSRGSLNKIAKMEPIMVINEVS